MSRKKREHSAQLSSQPAASGAVHLAAVVSLIAAILAVIAATTGSGKSFAQNSVQHARNLFLSTETDVLELEHCDPSSILSAETVLGFFPVCVTRKGDSAASAHAFYNGRSDNSSTFELPVSSYTDLRKALESQLQLEVLPGEGEGGPPNKYPWQAFSPDGRHMLKCLADFVPLAVGSSRLILVFKGGVFIWPGVAVGHTQTVSHLQGIGSINMTTLSMQPLVFGMEHFLSPTECDHIQERAGPHLQPSPVSLMDHDKGKENTEWRTSTTYFLPSAGDSLLLDVDARVAGLTRQPANHQEDAQVLRYELGQRYDAHHDFFDVKYYQKDQNVLTMIDGGRRNRLVTVFWYLSDVEEGGETVFPRAGNHTGYVNAKSCTVGLKVKPQAGKVAMFYSLRPDGQYDDLSLHGACPVITGRKSAANKWVWNAPR